MVPRPEDTKAVSVTPLSTRDQQQQQVAGEQSMNYWDTQEEHQLQEVATTVDHLKNLLVQEKSHYAPCMDYLAVISSNQSGSAVSSGGDRVNEAWRRKLCEWCFEVVDHFGMEREVVSVAMNYLDRIVAKTLQVHGQDHHIAKREFQLVAVASLYIAVKLHGETDDIHMDRRRLNVDVFVELSRGFFNAEKIEAMELSILFNLDWHLNPPTPLKFIASMMRLIPTWPATCEMGYPQADFQRVYKAIFDISMFLTELSVCLSTFTFHSKNSIVAYASILCAMEALEDALPLPYETRVQFVNQVAAATGLLPESDQVRCVRNLLKELCPAIEERDVASLIMMGGEEEDDGGKASPICVSYATANNDLIYKHHYY
ncbi:diatom-specific cyclin [Seminavis robusta]|uniref:Diatom-specific cyclin n=1 Tax=Seminavis robusta TaxID=568900 RepID=A0A9N8DIK3_9STRA|nr:diatom-specific cyclin [Seminavis robusta]|eukprot:Sro107_g054050.1 diatom-specific cyclin (372) ;mRNA; f:113828-114943